MAIVSTYYALVTLAALVFSSLLIVVAIVARPNSNTVSASVRNSIRKRGGNEVDARSPFPLRKGRHSKVAKNVIGP